MIWKTLYYRRKDRRENDLGSSRSISEHRDGRSTRECRSGKVPKKKRRSIREKVRKGPLFILNRKTTVKSVHLSNFTEGTK